LVRHSTKEKPTPDKPVEIAVFDHNERIPLFTVSSHAYNWQQGSRAHWLSENLFIFNDFSASSQSFVAKVYSAKDKKLVRQFDKPVQDSYGTDYYLSLNYSRLLALRPDYGYRNIPPLNREALRNVTDDGIWRVEYEPGRVSLLFSILDVINVGKVPEFSNAVHKLNHISISPSGNKFVFLHRYYVNGRRFDRLMLGSADGSGVDVVSNTGMVSHYTWVDERCLLAYMRGPDDNIGYFLLDVHRQTCISFARGDFD